MEAHDERDESEVVIAGVGAVNVSLRRRLDRARARERAARLRALSLHEWIEAIRPEMLGILDNIARDKKAPIEERRAAERAPARHGYLGITPGGTPGK